MLAVPITMQVPTDGAKTAVDRLDLLGVDLARTIFAPHAAAIGAGTQHFALVMAHNHRTDRDHHRRQIGADSGHDLCGQRLVTAADHHDRVHRLRADHLLGIHRHQIAKIHRGRIREALGDGNGREHHRHGAGQHDAALHRLDQLRNIAVAGIVVAVGVGDADDGALQRVIGIAHCLDEGLTQEQRKPGIAVAGQPLLETLGHFVLSVRFLSENSCASGT